jgi:tyrosyl-tRNA synthetase
MKANDETIRQLEIIKKGTSRIHSEEELDARLAESIETGIPLRVKVVVDPSTPDIHLGFAAVLKKLREFQDLGHRAVLVVGDYSARVGDPTGRERTRPHLSEEEIRYNAQTYIDQMGKLIDKSTVEITYNGKWYRYFTFLQMIELLSLVTVHRMLDREDFQSRFKNGIPISLNEMTYPLLNGYDSVKTDADIELGGDDQFFNVSIAREVQKAYNKKPQAGVFLPLLPGSDGVMKMSKSYGNHIGIAEAPGVMFEKLLFIPDWVVGQYYSLLLGRPEESIEETIAQGRDMDEARFVLAREVVAAYHGSEAAARAEKEHRHNGTDRLKKEISDVVIPTLDVVAGKIGVIRLISLLGMAKSNRDAEELVGREKVSFNKNIIKDSAAELSVKDGDVIRVGRFRAVRLKIPGK